MQFVCFFIYNALFKYALYKIIKESYNNKVGSYRYWSNYEKII